VARAVRADLPHHPRVHELATDVRGDPSRGPTEVIRRSDVREEREALLVPQVLAGLAQALRLDDERRLAVRLPRLEQARNVQDSTPRSS
jgi:hypothetical protein